MQAFTTIHTMHNKMRAFFFLVVIKFHGNSTLTKKASGLRCFVFLIFQQKFILCLSVHYLQIENCICIQCVNSSGCDKNLRKSLQVPRKKIESFISPNRHCHCHQLILCHENHAIRFEQYVCINRMPDIQDKNHMMHI